MTTFNPTTTLSPHAQYDTISAVKKGKNDMPCETCLMVPIALALIIIAGLTLGGVMSGSTSAWSMIGLSIPLILGSVVRFMRADSRPDRIQAIFSAIIFSVTLIMGSLALTNVVPMTTATITILSAIGANILFQAIAARCCNKNMTEYNSVENDEDLSNPYAIHHHYQPQQQGEGNGYTILTDAFNY